MGYIVLTWDKKTDCSAQLLQLFKVYSKFLDLAKVNLRKNKIIWTSNLIISVLVHRKEKRIG